MARQQVRGFSRQSGDNVSSTTFPNRGVQILMSIQVLITFISLIHAWTLQYKSDFGPDGFINRVSYISADKPWMPPGTNTSSLLHLHYFGDWVLNVAYGGIARPYDPVLEIPAQFAPVGLIFFNIAYLIGYKISYLILLLLTIFIWFKIINKLFPRFVNMSKFQILFFFVFATMPALITFDRGGTQLFCVGLAGLAYVYKLEGKSRKSFCVYLLAVSMKPYLIFFILVLLLNERKPLLKRVLDILKVGTSLLLVNALALTLYTDNLITGIRDEFNAISRFAGDWGIPWMMDGASITSFVSKTYEFKYGNNDTIKFMENFVPYWPRVIAAIFIVLLLFVLLSSRVIKQVKILLLLSTTSLVSPFSGPYTLAWISLAFCYLLSEVQNGLEIRGLTRLNKASIYSMIVAFYLGLMPYFGFLPKFSDISRHVPGNYLYVPFVLAALLLATLSSLPKTHFWAMRKVKNGQQIHLRT